MKQVESFIDDAAALLAPVELSYIALRVNVAGRKRNPYEF